MPCTHELGWFGTEIREGDIRYQLGVVPMGPNVNAFEKDLEAFANSKSDGADSLDRKVVCMSAGTAAVHLALIGCGVKAGDEVLIFNCAGACLLCFLGYLRFARWFLRFARGLTLMAAKAINGLEFFVHAMP
mgnify:CR=1 FL=1